MSFEDDYGYLFEDEHATQFTPTVDFAQTYARDLALDRGIPADDFVRQIGVESGWNPEARGAAGEVGYGQFMPDTASALGVDRNTPIKNLTGSADFMSDLTKKYGGDYATAAMAYNAGEGAVDNNRIPSMSKDYAAKVTGQPLPTTPSFGGYSPSESSLPTSNRRLADLSAAQEEIDGLQGVKSEALGQLGKGSNMSGQEALITALTALVPTLIGWGSGGLQGAGMGAQAGAQGAGLGLAGFAAEAKEREAASKLAYADAATSIKDKRGEIRGIRDSIADEAQANSMFDRAESGRNARSKEYNRTLGANGPGAIDAKDKEVIDGYGASAQAGVNFLNTINTEFKDKLGVRYQNKDGSWDMEGIKSAGRDQLEAIFGGGTKGDQLRSSLQEFVARFKKELTGTASSEQESARIEAIAKGGGLIPADVPTIYKNVERMIANQQAQARRRVELSIAAKSADPMTSIMGTFPTAPTMGGNEPTSQEGMTHTYPSGNTVIFRNGKWEPQ